MWPVSQKLLEETLKKHLGPAADTVVVSSPGPTHVVVEICGKNGAPISSANLALADQVVALIFPVGIRCDVVTPGILVDVSIDFAYAKRPTAPKYAGRECPCGIQSSRCEYHRCA